jgi:16S rRNA (guanine(966)-N(2))-methyltransferase RsmD
MGAEALCRGASLVVGIERSSRASAIVRQNWQQVARENQEFQVIQGDVVQRLKTLCDRQFDRIYFDPPYASDLYQPVLEAIAQYHLLASTGELAVEHSSTIWQVTPIPALEICRQKVYGSTAVTFYRPVLLEEMPESAEREEGEGEHSLLNTPHSKLLTT